MTPKYNITPNSISIVWEGKPHSVQRGSINFDPLRRAIESKDWASVPKYLTVAQQVVNWAKGDFRVNGETVYYRDEPLPRELNTRIIRMAAAGGDPQALCRFWERLQKNPSWRSVQQLWPFLAKFGIPITPTGTFLAYKSVRSNMTDWHTGTVDNRPGCNPKVPRNKVSDDPREACHYGLHVGALGYVRSFHSDGTKVVCEVDPEHVVCVPDDCSQEKMRVSEYRVIGMYGAKLPDGLISTKDIPTVTAPPPRVIDEDDEDKADEEPVLTKPQPPKKSKPKAKPKAAPEPQRRGAKDPPATKRTWNRFDGMDAVGLEEQSITILRKYASAHVQVVGAYKIPGGKLALVRAIVKARRRKR